MLKIAQYSWFHKFKFKIADQKFYVVINSHIYRGYSNSKYSCIMCTPIFKQILRGHNNVAYMEKIQYSREE